MEEVCVVGRSKVSMALACAALCVATLWSQGEAFADSTSLATVAASTRVAYHNAGPVSGVSPETTMHLGARVKFLYALGAELEVAPLPSRQSNDIYRPLMRMTGHLHLMNFKYFDLYLGAGTAADTFGDLVNFEGRSTLLRAGGGFEVILGSRWAIGVDGYWSVPALGHFNERLSESLREDQGVPDPMGQVDPHQIEVGLALRLYL